MKPADRRGAWALWLSRIALGLALGGVAAALIAALGTGAGTWSFRAGLGVLPFALFAAIGGAVLAIVAFLLGRNTGVRTGAMNAIALVVAVLFTAYLGRQIAIARSVPAIHDVATDLQDLPQFRTLSVRPDNLANVPDGGRPELAALSPENRWKALHREAYGDLRPLRLAAAPAQVLQQAERLARERRWAVARVDPQAGTLEATATTLFFRFKDDVVIRVRPDPARAGGAVVDMRSLSRVGGSDVGVNAKRIRAFLRDLQAAVG